MTVIYSDARYTVAVDGGQISSTGAKTGKTTSCTMEYMVLSDALTPAHRKAVVAAWGGTADGWYLWQRDARAVSACLLMPPETRPAVEAAIASYRAKLDAERPAREERQRIADLYDRADAARDYPARSTALRAQANRALVAWRERYPAMAREEEIDRLERLAQEEERLGRGALGYSADGWLDQEAQEERVRQYNARAAELRAQAAALRAQA